ncbi:MAG TPA: hypothetical protein ENK37_06440 [Oceanithermus profundus]|uniref:histidine kinase n=1 Tax=Oceanithermus profundus TaxID=187137 RepID=A0A7C4Z5P8_9DEIN|nr:hypothetical protein [Oceanithermus profundus]
MRLRAVIIFAAVFAYLSPLAVFFIHYWARGNPAVAALYYRYHLLVDAGITFLAAGLSGVTVYWVLRYLLAPWLRLERELEGLLAGRERLRPVGEEHADRIVGRINELLRISRDYLDLQELEFGQLAAGIHDDAVQTLIAARWALAHGEPKKAERLLRQAERSLRRVICRLAPPELEHLNLTEAIAQVARRQELEVAIEGPANLDEQEAIEVYRIVQHALANARRHGQARRAWVRIEKGQEVRVTVDDDGRGGSVEPGQGLRLLEARMRLRAGRLEWTASPHGGVRLAASWPVET